MSDDQNKLTMDELLSSLMDGETSDFELRRIVKDLATRYGNATSEDTTSTKWARYHIARAALHKELSPHVDIDLSARIRNAISEETVHHVAEPITNTKEESLPPKGDYRLWRSLSSVAVAASVAFAVVFGWHNLQNPEQNSAAGSPATIAQTSGASLPNPQTYEVPVNSSIAGPHVYQVTQSFGGQEQGFANRNGQFVDNNLELVLGSSSANTGLKSTNKPVLTVQHQQRLNSYFVTHTSQAAVNTVSGLMPFVRVVDLPNLNQSGTK